MESPSERADDEAAKVCSDCGGTKPLMDFHRHALTKDGRTNRCKVCAIAKARSWYAANRNRAKSANRNNYQQGKERYKKRASTWTERNPERRREIERKSRKKQNPILKREVFAAYGGAFCACCGETEMLFLSIDHMDNNGAAHRRSIGRISMYSWLKKNGYPTGFQVLCHNCNRGKFLNGGVCPHKTNGIEIREV